MVPRDVHRQRAHGESGLRCAVWLQDWELWDVPAEQSVDWRSCWAPAQQQGAVWVAAGPQTGAPLVSVPVVGEQSFAGERPVFAGLSSGEP